MVGEAPLQAPAGNVEDASLERRFGGLERLYGVQGARRIRRAHVVVWVSGVWALGLLKPWHAVEWARSR